MQASEQQRREMAQQGLLAAVEAASDMRHPKMWLALREVRHNLLQATGSVLASEPAPLRLSGAAVMASLTAAKQRAMEPVEMLAVVCIKLLLWLGLAQTGRSRRRAVVKARRVPQRLGNPLGVAQILVICGASVLWVWQFQSHASAVSKQIALGSPPVWQTALGGRAW